LRTILISVLLGTALACGGGGGGTSSPAPSVTSDPEGIYTGTVNSAQAGSLAAFVAATPSGELRYVASNDYLAVAEIPSASGTLYYGQGGSTYALSLSGVVVNPGASASGHYSGAGDTGSFSFTYNSLYTRPQALASLAGYYSAVQSTTGLSGALTLDAAGNVSGSDPSGAFSGNVVQLDPTKNLYRVSINYANGRNFSGLAFWSDASSGLVANAFYVQVSGVNNAYALGAIFTKY